MLPGEVEQALRFFEHGSYRKEISQALILLGRARRDKGDYDGAIADYTEALRLNPADATAYYNRGLARTDKGDLDGAIERARAA